MATPAPDDRGPVWWRGVLVAACALLTVWSVGVAGGGVEQLLWMGAGGGALDRLRERVERLADGDDVDFSTDRSGEVGRLAAALDTVASRLRASERSLRRERDRADAERARRAALLEGTSDCVARVTVAEDPRVQSVDDRFEETFGRGRDDLTGASLAVLLTEATVDDDEEAVTALLEGVRRGEGVARELLCRTPGGVSAFDVRFVPVAPGENPEEGYVVSTEVDEAAESQRRLEAIVENTSNQIFIKDREGRYRYVNEATAETFGYEPEEMEGLTDEDLFDEESAARIRADDRRIVETGELVTDDLVTTIDGEEYVFLSNKFPYRDASGEVAGVMGISRDITRRVRSERRLQAEKERFKTLVSNLPGMVYRCRNEPGWPMTFVSEGCADLTGYDASAIERGEVVWGEDVLHPDHRETAWDTVQTALADDEPFELEYRILTDDDEVRWVWERGRAVENDDGEVMALEGYIFDVTDRKRHERALASLHEATRELLTVESEQGVADLVVETAATVLDSTAVALYRFDAAENVLDPVAHTGAFTEGDGEPPTVAVGEGDSPVWSCFVDDTPRAFEATDAVDEDWTMVAAADGGLLVPVGDHGVFLVATPTVDEDTRRLVETLGATTEAAFDRLESEANLREREAELEARNRRLQRQVTVTDIIRTIDRSLVGAESREAIEAAVCEGLADSEEIAFAWIGHREDDRTVTPLAWAGDDQGYLDAVPLGADEPAAVTAREGTSTLVDTIGERLSEEEWARHAVERGFGAAVCVPLSIEAHAHGVLTVYAAEAGAFGDLELSVFEELGGNIAHAIEAVNARRALHADSFAELRFEFDGGDTVLGRIARAADATVEYEGLADRGDDDARMFVSVADADAGTVAAAFEDLTAVADHRSFASSEDDHVFEVTPATTPLASRLVQAGTRPRSLTAEPEQLTALVDIPAGTDVRELVQRLGEQYDGAHLVARRDVDRARTQQELVESLFDRLTDRQLEVLRTAYFAGFFEWPRESTGEEVAEMIGVSQPTVNRHLRLAQRALLAALFEQGTHGLAEE